MSPSVARRAIAAGALTALLAVACADVNDLPRLTRSDLRFRPDQSSKIFAAGGRLITTLHGIENRTVIFKMKLIPEHLRRAVVAIEDQRFYEHEGIDFRAIVRAAVANVTSGRVEEGGSTITQQYVKNVLLSPRERSEKTLGRKLKEAALARQIERRLSKKQILKRYLNTVYFGNGAYGVQAAARTYFGKPVWALTLRESALLAGVIRSPVTYDPMKHPVRARARRNLVLRRMAQLDFVDRPHARRARRKPLGLSPAKARERYPAAYFVDYVQRLIMFDPRFEHLGDNWRERQQLMYRGGLRIHTTVNLRLQALAQQAVRRVLPYPRDPHASLVAIVPQTGHVRVMVGGRDFFARGKEDRSAKTNLALSGAPDLGPPSEGGRAPGTGRQAGSAFKVFALAAAVERGIPLSKTYPGPSCLTIPGADNGGPWRPCNYESGSYGNISLLDATANSVNTVYAQLSQEIGAESVVNTAREMGIRMPLQPVASAVLGTNAVNPLDMASAYGTLATNGVHHPPVAITRITNARGKVLYRNEPVTRQAITPAAAFITTKALEQVLIRGTAAGGGIGRAAAGKTGTAQDYRDAWFVGYTPDLVTSVWVGYPEGQIAMKAACPLFAIETDVGRREVCRDTRITVTGGSWPTDIWQSFMIRAVAGTPPRAFPPPATGLISVEIDLRNGCLADRFTPQEERALATFTPGTAPTTSCHEPGDAVVVPDVAGTPAAEAAAELEAAGFVVQRHYEPSATAPAGEVIGQSPGGGLQAPQGATVIVTVSSGNVVRVPSVVGQLRPVATASLSQAGFDVRVLTQPDSGRAARRQRGRVWKQSPASGQARHGSTVTIWVNPG